MPDEILPVRYLPSKEKLAELISHLRPDAELYSGRKFFAKLLEYKGVEGVVEFIDKASKALSDKGELDLYFDFDSVDQEAFRKSRVNYMSRRGFLGVVAVGVPGAVFATTGVTGLVRQARDLSQTQISVSPSDPIDAIEHFVHKQLYPVGELLIGAALINEAYEKALAIKIEQIADAVTELDLKMQKATKIQSVANR